MRATVVAFLVLAELFTGCRKAAAPVAAVPAHAPPAESDIEPRCVFFKDLRAFLPESVPGFKQVKDEGSTGKYGEVQVSEAKRTFAKSEGREVSVRIVDTTMATDLGKAIQAAAHDAADKPADDPTAPLFLADAVGFIRFDPSRSDPNEAHAEATLWVGNRYVVAVTSQGFAGTTEVRSIARRLDLKGLSKLR